MSSIDPLTMRQSFLDELHALLSKYGAEITAKDHWQGYPECGEDIRMTVEFSNYELEDIDLGTWVDASEHGQGGEES